MWQQDTTEHRVSPQARARLHTGTGYFQSCPIKSQGSWEADFGLNRIALPNTAKCCRFSFSNHRWTRMDADFWMEIHVETASCRCFENVRGKRPARPTWPADAAVVLSISASRRHNADAMISREFFHGNTAIRASDRFVVHHGASFNPPSIAKPAE